MKSKVLVMLIFGWFFVAQTPAQSKSSPEAIASMVVGPFRTEAECKAQHDEMKDFLEAMGITHRMLACIKKQEV